MYRLLATLIALVSCLVVIPVASGDGLPVLGIDVGSQGIAAPGGTVRYVTLPSGNSTAVAAVRRDGGDVVRSASYPGTWTIPAVAYDRSAGGLSGDRRTLVLITPRRAFPRAETPLLVLRASLLDHARLIRLRGDFSFDAVSPDGSRVFLIQYTSPIDPTRYVVRAYDVARRKLVATPVVDPADRAEKMRGNPLSRTTSPDGRWAYTLYDGGGARPFVHALDTQLSVAKCIDLGALPPGTDLRSLRLRLAGGSVDVRDGTRTLLSVDRRTYLVAQPHAAASPRVPVAVTIAGVAALLAAAGALVLRRRRPPAAPVPVD